MVRELAALEWTEALTLISENDVPDSLYDEMRKHFDEKEIVALSIAIVAINGWNRLSIGFRTVPGSYKPHKRLNEFLKTMHLQFDFTDGQDTVTLPFFENEKNNIAGLPVLERKPKNWKMIFSKMCGAESK